LKCGIRSHVSGAVPFDVEGFRDHVFAGVMFVILENGIGGYGS